MYSTLDVEVENFDIAETDGYETDLTLKVLKWARSAGITTVLDGGSVKSYTEELLPFTDVAIVSEPFAAGRSSTELFDYLANFGVKYSAITRGSKEILYLADGITGTLKTFKITVVDDYISLNDLAVKKTDRAAIALGNWMRNRNTVEFLGIWQISNSPDLGELRCLGINSFWG